MEKTITKKCWLCERDDISQVPNPFQQDQPLCIGCYEAIDEAFDVEDESPYRGSLYSKLLLKTSHPESEVEIKWLQHLVSKLEARVSVNPDPEDLPYLTGLLRSIRARIQDLESTR